MSIPGYDAWKLATPPSTEVEDDDEDLFDDDDPRDEYDPAGDLDRESDLRYD